MTSSAESSASATPLAILSAPGSRGDVNPMIAIGRSLRQRGFDVVIALAEPYAALAQAAGLQAVPLVDQQRFDQLLSAASLWKPLSGARAILQGAASEFLQPHFDLIQRLKRPGRTVLVAHPLDFASRIHRDLDPSLPLATVVLSPAMIRNPSAPPRLTPWWFEPRRPAWLVRTAYWMADHLLADRFLGDSLNPLRRRHGLPPVRRILHRWWLSPDLVLALYPSWFAGAEQAAVASWHTCGFPLANSQATDRLTADHQPAPRSDSPSVVPNAEQSRPIFFTPGTAHRHARRFFQFAIHACRQLNRPGILASSQAGQVPEDLPPGVRAAGYVPLDQVLPGCAAIVHHGGVGTTAAAIAAACPQVILPMAFDQFHHGDRIVQLGLGQQVTRPTAARLTAALASIIDDPRQATRCRQAAQRLADHGDGRGAEVAAERIAALLQTSSS